MSLSAVIDAPKRYLNLTWHIIADASHCRPHHLTKKQKEQKKTAAAKTRRDAEREDYSVVLQGAIERIESGAIKLCKQFGSHSRKFLKHEMHGVSRWNAYLHHKAKLANENCEEGAERQRAHQLSMTLQDKWNSMSN
ncbi:hypothetical protein C0992_000992 [Termitomyces sp. T32_za158]|nr:hypothetical protein C0992_000992 [Termitomyces sp. T32_za158]